MPNEIQSIQMYPSSYNKEKDQYKALLSNPYIVIDQHLTWKEHVYNICSKAIKAKAFLQ